MKRHLPRRRLDWAPESDPSTAERALLRRYMDATDKGDAAGMVELLREDAFFSMPPNPQWSVGREEIVAGWVEGGFGSPSFGEFRCLPTRANAQPAVACYLRRPGDTVYRPFALDVLRIENGRVAEIVAFPLEPLVEALGLPATLSGASDAAAEAD